jgi:predicted TPR repeat methyltransferase
MACGCIWRGSAPAKRRRRWRRRVFDQHAPEFDEALVGRLGYRGPELLLEAVREIAAAPMRFEAALDLGCGTGLAGAAFRLRCERLVGVDISPGMIERARLKGVYDRLEAAELSEFLAREPAKHYSLVLAADVFVYCADLTPICAVVARVLAPRGLFAFTVETHDDSGVRLQETLRYAHSAENVRVAIEAVGLRVVQLTSVSTRSEKGVPVPGLLAVAG